MSGQRAETPNRGEAPEQQQIVGRNPDKRTVNLSRKALENAVREKRHKTHVSLKRLEDVMRSAQEMNEGSDSNKILRDLEDATEKFKITLDKLQSLYTGDKLNYLGGEDATPTDEGLTLSRAHRLVEQLKIRQSDKLLETSSRHSRHSKAWSSSTSSSAARVRALAEAAAARENTEYGKLIAEKEHKRRKREAEIERNREEGRAQHDKNLAILVADKKVAVANTKLQAIKQAIVDEEIGEKKELPGIPTGKREEQTSDWVRAAFRQETPPPRKTSFAEQNTPQARMSENPPTRVTDNQRMGNGEITFTQRALSQPFVNTSTPINITGSQLIASLSYTNERIVAGLARQNLPKCHPDTFSGDPTLFHPWKASFKAMIADVNVQEINYLRSFTNGEAQKLVDNYLKRTQHDPNTLLTSLWAELERRFGSAAVITRALLERMNETATFGENDIVKLQEFADLCADLESQLFCLPGLACLNFPNAIQPIAEKLPPSLRGKWEKEIAYYSERNGDEYPGFQTFSKVVQKQARTKNNPNILAGVKHNPVSTPMSSSRRIQNKGALKTETRQPEPLPKDRETKSKRCPFHEREGHSLEECKSFGTKTLEERTEWILKAGLCYRCLSEGHRASACMQRIECSICKDKRHTALLHWNRPEKPAERTATVETKCTTACRANERGVSCGKERPTEIHRVYAIINEQSNSSLISSELADELGAAGPEEKYYLTTCSGEKEIKYGRRVTDVIIQSPSGVASNLPTLIECDSIPQDKREIPTKEMARRFQHLHTIASEIPPLDESAGIHLLIGRDAPELLKVREFRNGPKGTPWAQRLSLGWTIIGQMCLDVVGGPAHVLACRTSLLTANSIEPCEKLMEPERYELVSCPNQFRIKDGSTERQGEDDVFHTTKEDNDVSLSCEDRKFLEIMETGICKNDGGNWEMPLPFRHEDCVKMPNNRSQAVSRLNGLIRTLRRKPQMETDYMEFMQKILDKGHASPVPSEEIRAKAQSGRVWNLPHFGVYHPKKPTQIRVVFDSSAEYEGVSLNKELLSGPDLVNNLLGVLMRFRRETTAVMCNIEQMFHSFNVDPKHRDFLRFLWSGKPITEYRMNVHLFGNGPSPAVATFGLRKTATDGEEMFGTDAAEFVRRNFYVDDGLVSLPTAKEAIARTNATQAMLSTANLRLHKIVSNSIEVMEAFTTEDRGKCVRDLELHRCSLPAQRSLGVYWDLEKDTFTFQVSLPDKPFTRRGVLSTVNSIYDPLGLAVPVLLEGRLLLQQLVIMGKKKNSDMPLGWDDPLPETFLSRWQRWRDSLADLENVSVPRCYHPAEFGTIVRREIHTFSDASNDAIGAAIYIRQVNDKGETCTALLFGQSKVAPVQITSIPRLELCAAVLATQAVAKIAKEIDMEIEDVTFYTDSKVVLGYIQNESRRFYVYVVNRVQLIRKISSPNQWRYVDMNENPADLAIRCADAKHLAASRWLTGPRSLHDKETTVKAEQEEIPLNDADPFDR